MNMETIPFNSFDKMHSILEREFIEEFKKVLSSNWFITGKRVQSFEKVYANFNQTKYSLGISNGLDALFIALKTLGVGEGDEVIVPSNTFIASVLAVTYCKATPVFVEPRLDTYNIDPSKIEEKITLKTKVIMPVHLYGQACEMNEIMSIARKHNLYVVEDNAQAQGALYHNQLTGSFGDINATSFYPGKNLGALGDAGGITTNDKSLYDKANVLRNYGSTKKYEHDVIGYNKRLDELQAAFLELKLQHLKKWNGERNKIADMYNHYLSNVEEIILPKITNHATSVYHLFVIRTKDRNELQQYLSDNGIKTLIHYPIPPHLQKAYTHLGFNKGSFPIAEELAETCLSLPIYIGLEEKQVEKISNCIKTFYNKK